MMTVEQTAMILDRLGAALNREISPDEVDAWHAQLQTCDPDLAMQAADDVVSTQSKFWPWPADFLAAYRERVKGAEAKQARIEQGPVTDCECRATGWIEVEGYERNGHRYDNVVRPCEFCNPKGYEQWATQWKPDLAARRRQRRPVESLPANPKAGISTARDVLKHIDDVVDDLQPF